MGATMGKSGGGGSLFDSINSSQTLQIVMLGLDSAGKTTVLYRLKFDQYLNTVPTIGFNCEKIRGTGKAKGVQFLVWDVGGQEKLRPLWRSYTRCTDGIVFVLDSVDVERMEEAKIELMRTANSNLVSGPRHEPPQPSFDYYSGYTFAVVCGVARRRRDIYMCLSCSTTATDDANAVSRVSRFSCWPTSRIFRGHGIRRRLRSCSD